ncbi:DNA-binding MarR family transcriptional regulator [Rhodovulum imhoffii]|uniref:DNA-binding MarR family transcriptional regulator n=1 Tax=Rhodovulum imhoffii TaxID=365340 RepID=A0A2T5BSD4_9RHOB|nr:MarR family winged helix-turn-helix transcriptional regulator [Rhodovulum imhoffii]MBK5933525.1 hypothetical protein [Rhodovulum imhoffii]PTN02240.1 DNA-binding MarR family transcriptional regulator [Rhodovulum imhoffii]
MTPKDLSRLDLQEFLPYQLNATSERIRREGATRLRAHFDLSVTEWRVLMCLLEQGPVSVREIHERLNMEKSKVSRAGADLVEAGYVSKQENAADRRLIEMRLTSKGRALMDKVVPLALDFQDEIASMIGPDYESLKAGLRKLSDL